MALFPNPEFKSIVGTNSYSLGNDLHEICALKYVEKEISMDQQNRVDYICLDQGSRGLHGADQGSIT